jgi:RHH-type rel operon transcriptional repressor/antitoxin RelB
VEHTSTMTIRLPAALKDKLERLAEATERNKSYLAARAIEEYVDAQEWQVQAIREAVGLSDSAQANFLDHEAVVRRLQRKVRIQQEKRS